MKSTRAALTEGSKSGARGNLRGSIRSPAFGELGCHGAHDGDALRWYGKGAGSIALDSTDKTRRLDCLLMEVERAYQNRVRRWGPKRRHQSPGAGAKQTQQLAFFD
jgi:hypothetical protein